MNKFPRLTRFLVIGALANVAILSLLRLIFWGYFKNPADPAPSSALAEAFYLGFKFDLRLTLIILLPLALVGWFKWLSPFHARAVRLLWTAYLTLAAGAVLFVYSIDFGHYAYLSTHVNYTVLRFLDNPDISFGMMWESYPIVWISLGLLAATSAYGYGIHSLFRKVSDAPLLPSRRRFRIAAVSASIFAVLFGIYGKFAWYPLRWSEAFFSPHPFVASVAVNPLLYFYDTYLNGGIAYDEKKVRRYHDAVAHYLGATGNGDADDLGFMRRVDVPEADNHPNVVMVFLESFAFYKTGLSGNPLNTTPHFDTLAQNGLYFEHFYVPHTGTARSVFATTTGIPDVQTGDTSSRNPVIVNQHTIINAFKDYERFYFLGGSSNWRNINGILSYNIPGLRIYEEGSYSSPRQDVWGISDLDLFKEANWVLREEQKPFFAIIQTAGNHRPYTIPEDNKGFQLEHPGKSKVIQHGFESEEEFNSFRFMDHSVGWFMDQVRKEPYFDNTIFVFFGDHGIAGDAGRHRPKADTQLELGSYNTPLVIYAPKLLKPRKFEKIGQHLDILPTLAAITGHDYVNTTFGRNLLDPQYDDRRYAFTIRHSGVPEIGLISDEFVYRINADGSNPHLYRRDSEDPRTDFTKAYPKQAAAMHELTEGIYESARYVLNHNKRLPDDVNTQAADQKKADSNTVEEKP